MEKLSDIPWGIPNDKSIGHKFEHESSVVGIAEWEISIHLQSVIMCLELFMVHPDLWHN